MMISPWEDRYQRPRLQRHTREFELPDGRKFELTLEEADTPAVGLIVDEAQELINRYVGTPGKPALRVALPDGTLLRASNSICRTIAQLLVLQRPNKGREWTDEEKPLTFLDWYGVSINWPDVWMGVQEFLVELTDGEAEEAAPNSLPETVTSDGSE